MNRVTAQAPILLCAATRWELSPLVRRWGLRQATAFRYEGAVNGVGVTLLKTGIGPGNAEEALRAVAAPRFLVSTGFAGALQPRMGCGDLVLDVQGLDIEIPQAAREIAARQRTPFHFGRMAHSDTVLARPQDKKALGQAQRCSAVDMESRALRAAAQRLGCPFLAARVILDSVEDRLPSQTPSGEGFFDLIPFALRNAGELPLMLKLGLRQGRAMKRLAIFLEEFLPSL